MNKDQIKKSVGHHVRLRPVAKRFDGPKELPAIDDDWIISRVDEEVELSNVRTGHFVILGFDHIYSYLSEPGRSRGRLKYGFLQLRVQLLLVGQDVQIEPLAPGDWGNPKHQSESRHEPRHDKETRLTKQPRIGTALEKAKRANSQTVVRAERLQLLTDQGMAAAQGEYATLRQTLDEKIADIQQHLTAIKLEQGADGHEYVIRTDRVSLNFYLYRTSPVTDSRIVVQEFDGPLILPQHRAHRIFVIGEEPRPVSKKEFHFDYQEAVGWCWKEKRTNSDPLTTAELAEYLITLVLELHERFQGRERVRRRSHDPGYLGPWS